MATLEVTKLPIDLANQIANMDNFIRMLEEDHPGDFTDWRGQEGLLNKISALFHNFLAKLYLSSWFPIYREYTDNQIMERATGIWDFIDQRHLQAAGNEISYHVLQGVLDGGTEHGDIELKTEFGQKLKELVNRLANHINTKAIQGFYIYSDKNRSEFRQSNPRKIQTIDSWIQKELHIHSETRQSL